MSSPEKKLEDLLHEAKVEKTKKLVSDHVEGLGSGFSESDKDTYSRDKAYEILMAAENLDIISDVAKSPPGQKLLTSYVQDGDFMKAYQIATMYGGAGPVMGQMIEKFMDVGDYDHAISAMEFCKEQGIDSISLPEG